MTLRARSKQCNVSCNNVLGLGSADARVTDHSVLHRLPHRFEGMPMNHHGYT
jgi:hypothetical protein